MSDNADSENIKNQHSALTSLWPSDTEESKKLAEEKQQKHQNLIELGNYFRQAREELGYNISDLDEHTGLSFTELEALEQGLFQHIEQQDYVDYYVHTYASLLSLDADEILTVFRQNYYQTEAAENTEAFDIHDEDQYEDAFAEEAKKTLEALEASSGVNTLEGAQDAEDEPSYTTEDSYAAEDEYSENAENEQLEDNQQSTEYDTDNNSQFNELQADYNQEPISSSATTAQRKSFPWVKLLLSFSFVLLAAIVFYLANGQFNVGQFNKTNDANNLEAVTINIDKGTDRVPEEQKAKKVGQLETKVINQGSDDLSAPTADTVQKPLVLIGETATETTDKLAEDAKSAVDKTTEKIADTVKSTAQADATENTSVAVATEPAKTVAKQVNDDLNKAAELAKAAEATKLAVEDAAKTKAAAEQAAIAAQNKVAEQPKDPIQEALANLPSDPNKFSLHATKNNWVLIEDDAAQILFSGELTPEKIITLPKTKGVIISLGDAGVIDVYKGKKLLGKLGAEDESLDLVSVEERFNQISN